MDRPKNVQRRIQISKWCRLIVFDDGTVDLWQGAKSFGLDPYEIARLGCALLEVAKERQGEQEIEALYEAAKAEESGYRAFLDSVEDDNEYRAWLEHVHDPRGCEY